MWRLIQAELQENKAAFSVIIGGYLALVLLCLICRMSGGEWMDYDHLLTALVVPVIAAENLYLLQIFQHKRYRVYTLLPISPIRIASARLLLPLGIWLVLSCFTAFPLLFPGRTGPDTGRFWIWFYYNGLVLLLPSSRFLATDLTSLHDDIRGPLRFIVEAASLSLHLILAFFWIAGMGLPNSFVFGLAEQQRETLAEFLLTPSNIGILNIAGILAVSASLVSFSSRRQYR